MRGVDFAAGDGFAVGVSRFLLEQATFKSNFRELSVTNSILDPR